MKFEVLKYNKQPNQLVDGDKDIPVVIIGTVGMRDDARLFCHGPVEDTKNCVSCFISRLGMEPIES